MENREVTAAGRSDESPLSSVGYSSSIRNWAKKLKRKKGLHKKQSEKSQSHIQFTKQSEREASFPNLSKLHKQGTAQSRTKTKSDLIDYSAQIHLASTWDLKLLRPRSSHVPRPDDITYSQLNKSKTTRKRHQLHEENCPAHKDQPTHQEVQQLGFKNNEKKVADIVTSCSPTPSAGS